MWLISRFANLSKWIKEVSHDWATKSSRQSNCAKSEVWHLFVWNWRWRSPDLKINYWRPAKHPGAAKSATLGCQEAADIFYEKRKQIWEITDKSLKYYSEYYSGENISNYVASQYEIVKRVQLGCKCEANMRDDRYILISICKTFRAQKRPKTIEVFGLVLHLSLISDLQIAQIKH